MMAFLGGIFIVLALLCIPAAILGLISPAKLAKKGKSPPSRIRILLQTAVMSVVFMGLGGGLLQDKSTPIVNATTTTPKAKSSSADAAPSQVIPDPHVKILTGRDAGAAFSEYVGNLQGQLLATSMTGQVFISKIKQDISFRELAAYREDAEKFKSSVQATSNQISETTPPDNLSDSDAAHFEKARAAAQELVDKDLDIAVDIAVNANTGIETFDDMKTVTQDAQRLRKTFEAAAMKGYSHFGFKRSEIDMATMTLKQAN